MYLNIITYLLITFLIKDIFDRETYYFAFKNVYLNNVI